MPVGNICFYDNDESVFSFAHGEAELRSPPKSDSTVSSIAESSPRSQVSFDGRFKDSQGSASALATPYDFGHAATFDCCKASDPVEEELCQRDEFGTSPANLLPSYLTRDIIESDPEEELAELERNLPKSPFEMVRGAPKIVTPSLPATGTELPRCVACHNTVSNDGDVLCQKCLAGCCAAITSGDDSSFLISM